MFVYFKSGLVTLGLCFQLVSSGGLLINHVCVAVQWDFNIPFGYASCPQTCMVL